MCNSNTSFQNDEERSYYYEDETNLTPSVVLRSKFRSAIGDDNFLLESFTNAINYFNTYSYSDARTFLWKLKFTPNDALEEFNFSTQKDDYDKIYISEDLVNKFYNELRYQYSLVHDGFLEVNEIPSCKKEFIALKKAVENDAVVYFSIYYICKKNCTSDYAVQKCVKLISMGDEKKIFGGLRMIGFPRMTANLVIPYANEIADLIVALNRASKEQNVDDNNFYTIYPIEEPVENKSEKKEIKFTTIETLFKHHTSVSAFLQAYEDLEAEGIDATWLIRNQHAIKAIFNNADNLMK